MSVNSSCRWGFVAFSVATLAASSVALAAGTFEGLSGLPGANTRSHALGISSDGMVVVGSAESTDGKLHAVRWSREGTIERIDLLPPPSQDFEFSEAVAASADGSLIVCNYWESPFCSTPFTLRANESQTQLLTVHRCNALAKSVSSAAVIGDLFSSDAFGLHWSMQSGEAGLLAPVPGYDQSSGVAISNRTGIVVGSSSGPFGQQATYWQGPGIGIAADPIAPGIRFRISRFTAVSESGLFAVGEISTDTTNEVFQPFIYDVNADVLTRLPTPPDGPVGRRTAYPTAISGDGQIIIGYFYSVVGPDIIKDAFIWRSGQGYATLGSVLTSEYGLNLSGWQLLTATGMSAAAGTIVGEGLNPSGQVQAWRAKIGEDTYFCVADFDESGGIDGQDVEAFFIAFEANDERADANRDGGVTGTDVEAFFLQWEAGECTL